ncbi:MAG TPA: ABC transporter permease [Longimicrobiales bacterium]|nr:ABC transporter permease [Longimicrobiales bacterium]
MRAVWAVIKREYLQRVRTRWFVIATIAAPLLLVALIAVPAILDDRSDTRERTLAVIDETGVLYEGLAPRLVDGGYLVDRAEPADIDTLEVRLRDRNLGGYMILDEATLRRGDVQFRTREAPSPVRSLLLRQAVAQSALEVRLGGDEADVRALIRGGNLDVQILEGQAGGMDEPTFAVAYIGAFLLYMTLLFYAVAVMRSVLEEKTSRIVEVVISSVRPFELMLGKILGVGAVGLTQFAIWIAFVALMLLTGLPALITSQPDVFTLESIREFIPGLHLPILFLVYFLGGYFIYSGLYAAVGAMCSSDEEAQQAQFPVILLLVVPIIFVAGVIQDPTDALSVGLSLVPFFTPILMFARVAAGGAAVWEIGLSIVLMAVTVLAVAWVAGRIYRVGILMAGKRPTLPELLRWVRES